MDTADSSLAGDCLYPDGHRQPRGHDPRTASHVDPLLAAAAPLPDVVRRPLDFLPALCRETAPASRRAGGVKSMTDKSASELIDRKIEGLGGWRGEKLSRLRTLIREADPQVSEELKRAKARHT